MAHANHYAYNTAVSNQRPANRWLTAENVPVFLEMSMQRFAYIGIFLTLAAVRSVHADSFDNYTNTILEKLPSAAGVQKITKLTPELMVQHSRVLPGITGTFLVVRTNEGQWSKLLVQPAGQKIDQENFAPILLVDRFVTFLAGTEKAVHTRGQNVRLFGGFRFSLDIGQVVPEQVPADLLVTAKDNVVQAEPAGKAELYLITKHVPEATPAKTAKVEIGAAFEPRHFNGSYKLFDDGRRSGTLQLEVKGSEVVGSYYSDKDGAKYPVSGKIGRPAHIIEFQIMFPRSLQHFRGWMFTGDGNAIAGSSRIQERESGFYATRLDQ